MYNNNFNLQEKNIILAKKDCPTRAEQSTNKKTMKKLYFSIFSILPCSPNAHGNSCISCHFRKDTGHCGPL